MKSCVVSVGTPTLVSVDRDNNDDDKEVLWCWENPSQNRVGDASSTTNTTTNVHGPKAPILIVVLVSFVRLDWIGTDVISVVVMLLVMTVSITCIYPFACVFALVTLCLYPPQVCFVALFW